MGQVECLNILERKKEWMTVKQLADILGQYPSNVNRALRKLHKNRDIIKRNAQESAKPSLLEWRAK